MPTQPLLRYRAGPAASRLIRSRGLDPRLIQAFVAPASGPKWLVLAGLDRALMSSGIVPRPSSSKEDRQLLAGASAGGWRVMTMATGDPEEAHAQLEHDYIHQSFPRGVGRAEVTAAYRTMLDGLFTEDRIATAIEHPHVDLAIHLARVRGHLGRPRMQGFTMVAAATLNQITSRSQKLLFERILLHSRPESLTAPFDGQVARLTTAGFRQAALATGSVPLYFDPAINIPGAPPGRYLDGGLTDYHLRQDFLGDREGITLFPHFQTRIVPNWFDRWVHRRRPPAIATSKLLQISPTPAFLELLPDRRIPTRQDFIDFADEPEKRITRWLQVTRESNRLGDQLLGDIEHERIPGLLEPIP